MEDKTVKKVTLCGTILLDVVKKIDRWPEKGNLVSILSQTRAVGGAVCNSGVDLKVLAPELTVSAIGQFTIEHISYAALAARLGNIGSEK